MSLEGYGSGGSGNYIGAKEMAVLIKTNAQVQIVAGPFIGLKTFGDEDKKVCEFPMHINGNDEEPRVWSAGKFAVDLLVESLGIDTTKWSYPVEGVFEYRPWETSKSSGVSAHFIPNGSGAPSTSPGTRTTASGPSPTTKASAGAERPASKSEYVADGIHFSSADDMAAYLKKTGKGKK